MFDRKLHLPAGQVQLLVDQKASPRMMVLWIYRAKMAVPRAYCGVHMSVLVGLLNGYDVYQVCVLAPCQQEHHIISFVHIVLSNLQLH
jgi:hypothetical protein